MRSAIHLGKQLFYFGVCRSAKSAKKNRYGKLSFLVYADINNAFSISFKLKPSAARGNNFSSEIFFTAKLGRREKHTIGTGKLRHNNTLNARDNKSAVRGH